MSVTHPGAFREQIPLLLLENDTFDATGKGRIAVVRGTSRLEIDAPGVDTFTSGGAPGNTGPYRLNFLAMPATDALRYTIRITADQR